MLQIKLVVYKPVNMMSGVSIFSIASRLILICLVQICTLDLLYAQRKAVLRSEFKVEDNYLKIPVKNGNAKSKVTVLLHGLEVRSFDVELADQDVDWYAYLYIGHWKGKTMQILVKDRPEHSKVFAPVLQSKSRVEAGDYKESMRGQFHFSPRNGWNNDPNGLVYFKGEYHLFFQHNPYGTQWGNMHWGHAVSTDLVHWKELDVALYPDEYGTMFSGGAVVDVENSYGLSAAHQIPMVLFYTAGEKSWKQGLACSIDGRNFEKLATPILDQITAGNRDPKVIWHAPSQAWVMVLYVTEPDDVHTMHFYRSTDLKQWNYASKVIGGKGDDRYLYECPEFYELAVEGNSTTRKWILTGGDSQYAIGQFDGYTFVAEQERLFSQQGRDYYAAQTFSNEPQGRRIEMGWWRTHTHAGRSSFNQSMSIPTEITLRETSKGLRLVRQPVDELKTLRGKKISLRHKNISADAPNPLKNIRADAAEIKLVLAPKDARSLQVVVRGLAINYQVEKEELSIDNVRTHVPLKDGKIDLHLFVDLIGVELFANDGAVFMPVNYNLDGANQTFELTVDSGEATLESLDFYPLKRIWKK